MSAQPNSRFREGTFLIPRGCRYTDRNGVLLFAAQSFKWYWLQVFHVITIVFCLNIKRLNDLHMLKSAEITAEMFIQWFVQLLVWLVAKL